MIVLVILLFETSKPIFVQERFGRHRNRKVPPFVKTVFENWIFTRTGIFKLPFSSLADRHLSVFGSSRPSEIFYGRKSRRICRSLFLVR